MREVWHVVMFYAVGVALGVAAALLMGPSVLGWLFR